MLRTILIAFGWIIPFVALILVATEIYISGVYRAGEGGAISELWVSTVQALAGGITSLALSPLCFFGAFMLDARPRAGE